MSDRLSVFRQKCQKDLICLPTTNRVGVAKMQANPPKTTAYFPRQFPNRLQRGLWYSRVPKGGASNLGQNLENTLSNDFKAPFSLRATLWRRSRSADMKKNKQTGGRFGGERAQFLKINVNTCSSHCWAPLHPHTHTQTYSWLEGAFEGSAVGWPQVTDRTLALWMPG